jgi:transposase InsO family protein
LVPAENGDREVILLFRSAAAFTISARSAINLLSPFRDECLNENRFASLEESRAAIEAWRQDYNAFRPHEALENKTPEEFVRGLINQQLPPYPRHKSWAQVKAPKEIKCARDMPS